MKKKFAYILLATTLTATIFFFLFKPVIQHPNAYLYSLSGDALKSYFNFSYYLKYDDGIRHDGINYPYGDHLQYINSHPLYVQVIKLIDKNLYPLKNHGVGILNLTMIISLILAVPFLFLILRKFALPRWYAASLAVILLLLTPQFHRIHGHFEMVYAFFLPMYWYLLIRWREGKKRWIWSSLLILSALAGGFTSAYYASFYAIFLLGVLFIEIWNHRKNLKLFLRTGLYLLLLAVIPLILVKGLVTITDWVADRPTNPYGFDVYHAEFLSVFLPFISPLKTLIGNTIDMNFEWEGRAYVGLPASLLAVSIFITGYYNLLSKRKASWKIFKPDKKLHVYFYASILVLLFSMCIPFKYGFGFLLEILPPIKQFRALGRFTWIFYYVFTVYAAWFFYRLYRLLSKKGFHLAGVLILVFVLAYWSIDAGTNIKRSTTGLFNLNDKFESTDDEYLARFSESGVTPDEFQAILFLPFANTCGDKLLFDKGMNAFSEAMKCSYHTGIPLIQSFSPRLSFTHALSSIQLLADPAIEKTRINDMNNKPLLLVCTKEKMSPQEAWLQSKAQILYEDDYMTLSTLSPKVFHESHQNWRNEVEVIKASLPGNEELRADVKNSSVTYVDFEESKSDIAFSGTGAFYKKKGKAQLLNQTINKDFMPGKYELSFWMFIDSRIYGTPQPTVTIRDENGSETVNIQLNTREVHDVYEQWIRVKEIVELKQGYTLQLWIRGEYITIDDILVRPVDSNVLITLPDSHELFNNFPFTH